MKKPAWQTVSVVFAIAATLVLLGLAVAVSRFSVPSRLGLFGLGLFGAVCAASSLLGKSEPISRADVASLIKSAVEVAAVVVAAVWALFRFERLEAPLLEPNIDVKTALSSETRQGSCRVMFPVTVTNKGVASLTLESVDVDVYEFTPSEVGEINFPSIMAHHAKRLTDQFTSLQEDYPLGQNAEWHHDLEWVMRPQVGREYYFRAVIHFQGDIARVGASWGPICSGTE